MSVLFLIESTALLLLALLLRQRCTQPSHRAAIGFAAMAALPLLALVQLADLGWHPLTRHLSLIAQAPTVTTPAQVAQTVSPWTLLWVAYGVVAAWRLLQWWRAQWRVRTWLRETRTCRAPQWQRQSRLIAETLGHRAVPVLVHDLAGSPFLVGWRRPCVVIPAYLEQCSEARARLVLLHEFGHWQARDPLRMQLVDLICCLLWFQPLLPRVRRSFRADIELACDDRVLRAGTDAHDYAETIALCAGQQRLQGAALVGMAMQRSQLVQRVTRILAERDASPYASLHWPLLALCAAGLLLMGVNFAPRVVVDATASPLLDATVDVVEPPVDYSPPAMSAGAVSEPAAAATLAQPEPSVRTTAPHVDANPRAVKHTTAPAPASATAAATPPAPQIDAVQLQQSIGNVVDQDAQSYARQHAGEPLLDSSTTQARFEQGVAQSRVERSARRQKILRRVLGPALGSIPLG